MKRWKVLIHLKNGERKLHEIEEMYELQELIETAHNWYDLDKIVITYNFKRKVA